MKQCKIMNQLLAGENIFFVCILFAQILVALYFNTLKGDLFIDEYFTFNFANANYQPMLYDCTPYLHQWLPADFWQKLVTVQSGEGFNYGAVVYNTAQDVHPPFYYFLIHTVCSCFPECFSQWFALVPNIIFFIITQYVLWRLGKHFLGTGLAALVPSLLYGFSMGFLNNILLLRMYMLLTTIVVVYAWLQFKYLTTDNSKYLFLFFTLNVMGFLTHYYFLVFAAVGYFFLAIFCLHKQNYRQLAWVTCGNVACLAICVAIFPACYQHILGAGVNSYRGNQAIAGFFGSHNMQEIILYYFGLAFDEPVLIGIFCLLPLILLRLLSRHYYCKGEQDNLRASFMAGLALAIFVIVHVLIRTNPFRDTRYFFYFYPLLVLCVCYYASIICKQNYILWRFFAALVVIIELLVFFNFKDSVLKYGGNENLAIIKQQWLKQQETKTCLAVLANKHTEPVVYNLGVFKAVPKSYLILQEDLASLNVTLGAKTIVYIADGVKRDAVKAKLQKLGYKETAALPSKRLSMGTSYLYSRK